MTKRHSIITLLALALAAGARADDEPSAKLPLDKLLDTPISTAAKYDQQMSHVAASVTVITAEEIERYGWTSLAEVLQSARGFYITYDRNYTYVGLRGIGRPTDYNNRLLILLDGVVLNEPLFGRAMAGDDLAIDLGTVEKIEIVRGPGSALYGTHAMLAVINIITKNADRLDGVSVSAFGGSGDRKGTAVRAGKVLAGGLLVTAAGYWQEANGANLYFPEFDSPATNNGVAEGRDYSDSRSAALSLQKGNFRLNVSSHAATKGVPTAPFGMRFNDNAFATNQRDLASAEYSRAIGKTATLQLRGYWDRSRYHGQAQYAEIGNDSSFTLKTGGEARLDWDLSPQHRITFGSEYADASQVVYKYAVGTYHTELTQPQEMSSYYVQYEGHPSAKWGVVAGVRRDDFSSTADSTNPRVAVLFTPNRSTSLKLLYGSAFRSPNVYEAYYSDLVTPWTAHPDLKPETIRTTELVWEQRTSPTTMLIASAFHINAFGLIDQELNATSQAYWYNNVGEMESNGIEVGMQFRRQDGLWSRFSAAMQNTESDGQPADNSPRYTLKSGISTSPWAPWHAGIEGVLEAGRRTRDGDHTGSFLLVNGIVSRQLSAHFRLALSSRNILNTRYSNPVGPELRQQSIRQDGRTFTMGLTYSK